MNHTERKALIKAIKSLKNAPEAGWPSSDTVERMDNRVMSYVQGQSRQSARPGLFFVLGMTKYLVSPRFAYTMAVIALMAVGAAAAISSQGALPGDTLYGAKLAVEKTQIRFTSNPARRAVVQMEFAGNRLKEARMIKQEGGTANGRVDDALTRFAKDVTEATDALKQAADPVQVKAATSEIAQKAEEYKQEIEFIVPLSKKRTRTVGMAAAAEQAEQALEGVEEPAVEEEDEDENKDEDEEKELEKELKEGQVGL